MFQPVLLGIDPWVSMCGASSRLCTRVVWNFPVPQITEFPKMASALVCTGQWRSLIPGDCADMLQGDGELETHQDLYSGLDSGTQSGVCIMASLVLEQSPENGSYSMEICRQSG